MRQITVVLVGFGRMGSRFFEKFVEAGDAKVKILAVCELDLNNQNLSAVRDKSIDISDNYEEVIERFGTKCDIILDTTNVPDVKYNIRKTLALQGNNHTVLVPMVVDYLMWYLLPGDEPIPQDHISIGY